MKTQDQTGLVTEHRAARILFATAALVAASFPLYADTEAAAAKTHTLFMGADISAGTGQTVLPVKGVRGSSWVVEENGKERVISAKDGPIDIKVASSLKLTEISATVADLKSERGYTEENDPVTRQTRAMARAADLNAGYSASVNQANAALVQAEGVVTATKGTSELDGEALIKAGYPAVGITTPTNSAPALYVQGVETATSGAGADLEMTGDRGVSSGFDAMNVSFKVSSERPLKNPYIVTVTQFHPANAKPGLVQNIVYARELNPIGAQPTEIRIVEGGFPPGFEVVSFQMHLYNAGQEVATTVSSKRVPLTRDEAFEYIKMEYVGAHKGATLQAVPVMGRLPGDLPERLAGGAYHKTYYVSVSKDGLARDLFVDAACSRKANDPYLESVVSALRFKPALTNGKPVDSVAPLNLTELKI